MFSVIAGRGGTYNKDLHQMLLRMALHHREVDPHRHLQHVAVPVLCQQVLAIPRNICELGDSSAWETFRENLEKMQSCHFAMVKGLLKYPSRVVNAKCPTPTPS